ncbi:uncharacterized protein LOC121728269 isoform X1 [Aricia agestis]|uniref:uncharacterized protein LOC121728269 isoform X1 n=1 Tax=Aricia agestis TaxID=91739 RepID=UPI001C2021E6|nr:uncharacterized protein LOC121728269 isoform X1 [Aricia agestis]
MSLLEDIFLGDEANEAQELERVIEGEEFEERARSDSDDNSEKEDEAEEDIRRVDPNTTKTKRVVRNPRFVLNPARLTGPRGIQVIPEHFKDFKFKGKGHEKEDLDLILKKLEHWAYRLYPKFQFEDCLKKIETLGKKRPVMVHLTKIRSGQLLLDETVVQKDSSDEETPAAEPEEDEFDRLLQQQIELARATPAPNSAKKPPPIHSPIENRLVTIPKATSSPSINEEQRERMLRSKKLAEEKRLARLKNKSMESAEATIIVNNVIDDKEESVPINDKEIIEVDDTEIGKIKRHNKFNVIDSSDEEDAAVTCVNESITVDIHSNHEIKQKEYNAKEKENVEENTINDIEVMGDIEGDRDNLENRYNVVTEHLKEVSNTNDNIDKESEMVEAESDIEDYNRHGLENPNVVTDHPTVVSNTNDNIDKESEMVEAESDIEDNRHGLENPNVVTEHPTVVSNTNDNIDKESEMVEAENCNDHGKGPALEETNTNYVGIEESEGNKSQEVIDKETDNSEVSKTVHCVVDGDMANDKIGNKEQNGSEVCEMMDVDFSEDF